MEKYIGLFEGEDSLRRVLEWKNQARPKMMTLFYLTSALRSLHPIKTKDRLKNVKN